MIGRDGGGASKARPWWLRLDGRPGQEPLAGRDLTGRDLGFQRLPTQPSCSPTDKTGRRWFIELRARGFPHSLLTVGSVSLVAVPLAWLWHLAKYPGQWYLEVVPDKGNWPAGVIVPDYGRGFFDSKRLGLQAMARLVNEIQKGSWPDYG